MLDIQIVACASPFPLLCTYRRTQMEDIQAEESWTAYMRK